MEPNEVETKIPVGWKPGVEVEIVIVAVVVVVVVVVVVMVLLDIGTFFFSQVCVFKLESTVGVCCDFWERLCRYMMRACRFKRSKLDVFYLFNLHDGSMLHSFDGLMGSRCVRDSPCLFWIPFDRSFRCNVPTFVWLAQGHHEPIHLSRIRLHVKDMDGVDMWLEYHPTSACFQSKHD